MLYSLYGNTRLACKEVGEVNYTINVYHEIYYKVIEYSGGDRAGALQVPCKVLMPVCSH